MIASEIPARSGALLLMKLRQLLGFLIACPGVFWIWIYYRRDWRRVMMDHD